MVVYASNPQGSSDLQRSSLLQLLPDAPRHRGRRCASICSQRAAARRFPRSPQAATPCIVARPPKLCGPAPLRDN